MNELITRDAITPNETQPPPQHHDVGTSRDWVLPLDKVDGGRVVAFTGEFIGFGSSKRANHSGHSLGSYAVAGIPCSACRWFETRLFAIDNGYIVYNIGESIVDGEVPFYRAEFVHGPMELIEHLTTVRTNNNTTRRTLNYPTRRALSMASDRDKDVRDALVQRMEAL